MNTEQLLKNLSELEKQLQGIKSATEQVKAIAGADKKLVNAINAYTANANQLLQSVQSTAKDDVKEVKDAAIKEIKATAKDFQKTTSSLATELTASIDGIKSTALEQMTGSLDGLGTKMDGLVTGFGKSVQDLKDSANQTIGETKAISDGLSMTADRLRTFVDKTVAEPLDKDLKETVNKSLKPLVNEELPKAFAQSLVRMEESFEGARKKIDDDWAKRQKTYDDSVKKQQESIDSSVRQLKQQAETFTATVDQFKSSIEGLETKVGEVKNETVRDLRQSLTEQADKMNGAVNRVMTSIGDTMSLIREESRSTLEAVHELNGDLHQGLEGFENRQKELCQGMSDGFDKAKSSLAETGMAIHTDNEATRKDVAGVFTSVKGNKTLLIITVILLAIVIVLQLAPMVLRFLK